jgi:2-oxoglutarate dehydrogenase E2 component (dihydrolipoamide succinyltransferase)
VHVDEPVLQLETDKATMELPATASGRLEIVEREGSTVRVGTVVARIAAGAEPTGASAKPAASRTPATPPTAAVRKPDRPAEPDVDASTVAAGDVHKERRPAETGGESRSAPRPTEAEVDADEAREGLPLSPAVHKLLAEYQLDPSQISGTGKDGRLTKDDVLRHIAESAADRVEAPQEEREVTPEMPPARAAARELPRSPTPDRTPEAEERKPMSRLRRRIAERLVEAQRTAAILTTFNEIDLSRLLTARQRHRERFRERHGVDLGLMSLFGRACVLALVDVPILNARIDGDDIVHHRHVHLGIAVSTSRGLVVPVVRDADRLSLAGLERAIEELARLARDAKLTPDHLTRGTFTITNGGVFGSLLSTPILNPPQAGVLGMHKIEERPVAVDGQVVIRPMMYVALSYDHRLVDGEQAVTFLVRVKERLEDPVRMLFEV